jgi:hypothetical protein
MEVGVQVVRKALWVGVRVDVTHITIGQLEVGVHAEIKGLRRGLLEATGSAGNSQSVVAGRALYYYWLLMWGSQ